MQFFTPHTSDNGQGFTAGLLEVTTDTFYVIDPLGQRGAFYSEAAATELSQLHAATANRLGLASLPHARKV